MKLIHASLLGLACTVLNAAGAGAPTAGPGAEVIVVYNSRVPESKAIAEYYAQRRQVPPSQLFGFALSTGEEMSRAEFRDDLQKPLAKEIENRKLWRTAAQIIPATTNQPSRMERKPAQSSIRYAVLCYGVPTKIAPDPTVKEEGTEKLRPEMRRNEAAVDSELAFLPLLQDKLPLSGPLRNPVYTATNTALLHPTNGVLIVARLDGPSADIARHLVDLAMQAETNGLWGRGYFDIRNTTDPGYKTGDEWIRNASEIWRRLGYETTLEDTPATFAPGFPLSQVAFYAGWYDEHVSGPFAQPTVEFMPGAFAYHLHSYSANKLRSTNQHWVGPLLAKGATATMGSVNEPYLSGTPDMAIFTARLVYNTFTFGEAALACQPVLSWQTTVVGDPLYRPFGQNPEQLHDRLQLEHSPWLQWSYLRLVNLNLVAGKPVADCVALLEQLGLTKESPVLSEKLADLYEAQGKPSSAVHEYERAATLKPTPMQLLRLRLTLGDRLTALGQEAEAYSQWQAILTEFPNYPDKATVYRKLVPLARKLGKKEDAEKYEAELNRLAPAAAKP